MRGELPLQILIQTRVPMVGQSAPQALLEPIPLDSWTLGFGLGDPPEGGGGAGFPFDRRQVALSNRRPRYLSQRGN